jgi:3'-phosphoadenosine 5'-phosphosulfate sulfotransferase (PAPS reductase)/FAD synthetase
MNTQIETTYSDTKRNMDALEKFSMIFLGDYDVILISSSGGKDSQAQLDVLVNLADSQGVSRDRLIVVHADLGRVEWKGTAELAERQAKHYGLRFEKVSRSQGGLLEQINQRNEDIKARALRLRSGELTEADRKFVAKQAAKMSREIDADLLQDLAEADEKNPIWPDSKNRYCTSDQKRGQISKLITQLHRESGKVEFKVLSCMGIRAQESDERAEKNPFTKDARNSTSTRTVDIWLPIFDWKLTDVWARIKASGVEYHQAYDLGMSRLSCVFCVFAKKADLQIAAKANPELLDEYIATEKRIGHCFKKKFSISELKAS